MSRAFPCPFFRDWRPDSAYVLGYWFADGNMYRQERASSYVVSIGSKDVAHLEALRALIGVGKLTRITGSEVFKLVICRKEAFMDLRRLGGMERKSLVLPWPEGVPAAFLPHLVRGYVDGDGCLTWNRSGNSVQPLLEAAGTYEFLTGMGMAIQEATGIPMPTRHKQKDSINTWKIAWYGIFARCLAIWLYQMYPGYALERKAVLAREFAQWEPKVFRRWRVTEKMWQVFGVYLPE
jgi:hypothetical protein